MTVASGGDMLAILIQVDLLILRGEQYYVKGTINRETGCLCNQQGSVCKGRGPVPQSICEGGNRQDGRSKVQ